jgi:hypothetical protein
MQALFRGQSVRKCTAKRRGGDDATVEGIQFSSRAAGHDTEEHEIFSDEQQESDDEVQGNVQIEDYGSTQADEQFARPDEAGIIMTQALFRGKLARKRVSEIRGQAGRNRPMNVGSGHVSGPSAAQRLGAMLGTLLASTVQQSQRLDSSFASISEQDPACEFFKCLLFWARLCCL